MRVDGGRTLGSSVSIVAGRDRQSSVDAFTITLPRPAEFHPYSQSMLTLAEASAFTGRGEVFLRALIACGVLPAADGPNGPLVSRSDLLAALGSTYDPPRETRAPAGALW
jgi:hypothetical protein